MIIGEGSLDFTRSIIWHSLCISLTMFQEWVIYTPWSPKNRIFVMHFYSNLAATWTSISCMLYRLKGVAVWNVIKSRNSNIVTEHAPLPLPNLWGISQELCSHWPSAVRLSPRLFRAASCLVLSWHLYLILRTNRGRKCWKERSILHSHFPHQWTMHSLS